MLILKTPKFCSWKLEFYEKNVLYYSFHLSCLLKLCSEFINLPYDYEGTVSKSRDISEGSDLSKFTTALLNVCERNLFIIPRLLNSVPSM